MAGPWGTPRRKGEIPTIDGQDYSFQIPISVPWCEYSTITQSRAWLPDPIGGVLWYAPSMADGSNFVPVYSSVTSISPSLNAEAGDHHTLLRTSYWWAVSAVNTYADLKYSYIIKDIQAARKNLEELSWALQPAVESTAIKMYVQNPEFAVEFLTDYCARTVEKARDAYWDLLDKLMCKYNAWTITEHGTITTPPIPEEFTRMMIKLDTGDYFRW